MNASLRLRRIGAFLDVVIENQQALRALQMRDGRLQPMTVARTLLLATGPISKRFTYVFGTMDGDSERQYAVARSKFEKEGRPDSGLAAHEMTKRGGMPCIDVQECLWLLTGDRGGDVGRDYGYSDYRDHKGMNRWNGNARIGYVLEWDSILS